MVERCWKELFTVMQAVRQRHKPNKYTQREQKEIHLINNYTLDSYIVGSIGTKQSATIAPYSVRARLVHYLAWVEIEARAQITSRSLRDCPNSLRIRSTASRTTTILSLKMLSLLHSPSLTTTAHPPWQRLAPHIATYWYA